MADLIQLRRDTAANWTSANPTLAQGEVGLELDTGYYKVGNGSTAWNSLDYALEYQQALQISQASAMIGTQTEIVENHAFASEDAANVYDGEVSVATRLRALDSEVEQKAAKTHTHTLSGITDFPSTVSATELSYLDGVTSAVQTQLNSKIFYHGFVNRTSSTLAFDDSSRVFTLGVTSSCQVYIGGVSYTISSPGLTIDLDDKTLSTGLWYIWVEVSGGVPVLNASKNAWSILSTTEIPCATVFWNGSAGCIQEERHSYNRNLQDHLYKHKTIGSRIENDGSFAQTLPTTTTDGQIQLSGGNLWDEDLVTAIDNPSIRIRNWYETAANTYTWANGTDNGGKDRPYIWNGSTSRVRFPNSSYVLTDGTGSNYIPVWVYAGNDYDTSRAIYIFTPTMSAAYNTLALARNATPPTPAFSPEIKLLWRWIYRGDGEFQEAADYRTSASLPSGGVTAPSALSVSFAPAGNIAATNVQAAIEELDAEKLPITANLSWNETDQLLTAGKGIILKSPNGTAYKVAVADGGTLSITAV